MKKAIQLSTAVFIATVIFSACAHKAVPTAAPVVVATTPEPVIASAIQGEKVYTASCGRCHELKNPASYTADQWGPIMKSMAAKAKLTSAEKADAMAYVVKNAKAVKLW